MADLSSQWLLDNDILHCFADLGYSVVVCLRALREEEGCQRIWRKPVAGCLVGVDAANVAQCTLRFSGITIDRERLRKGALFFILQAPKPV